MAESDIFVSNDIALDVDFGEIFVVDQGVVYKVIAEKYSSEKTYAVGDYVSHLEKLYRCITAVEIAEAFDEEKWTEVFLADEVQIANNNIALKANTADLATVATSGSYNDLTNKPTIPAAQVNSDWNADSGAAQILNKPNLATVATSGSYNDLTGKPEIPAAQVQADYGQADSTKIDYIKNKPNLATVATSGNYNDLTNKPTIPAAQVNSDWEASSGVAQILNKPTIPTVNDATITVVQGSTTKGTFTLNQSADAIITLDAGGGGGGAQVALTQAEYDALVQAGTVDPTVEYFITDGIPSAITPTITIYNGIKTNVLTDGECSITIADMGSGKIVQISGYFKANGLIPTTTEFTDLFIFDAEAIAVVGVIPNSTMLAYGQDSGFFFTRVTCHSATNAIASFWGTNADKWYSFNQTFIVKNSNE